MPKNDQDLNEKLDELIDQWVADRPQKPPVSERRLAANRANSKRSTGPKTEAGKKRVSKNAIRHGILSNTAVLDFECQEDFDQLAINFRTQFLPTTPTESLYVDAMISTHWRLLRIRTIETAYLNRRAHDADDDKTPLDKCVTGFILAAGGSLETFTRYESHLSRQHHRALRLLLELRKPKPPVTQTEPAVPQSKPAFRLTSKGLEKYETKPTNPLEDFLMNSKPLKTEPKDHFNPTLDIRKRPNPTTK